MLSLYLLTVRVCTWPCLINATTLHQAVHLSIFAYVVVVRGSARAATTQTRSTCDSRGCPHVSSKRMLDPLRQSSQSASRLFSGPDLKAGMSGERVDKASSIIPIVVYGLHPPRKGTGEYETCVAQTHGRPAPGFVENAASARQKGLAGVIGGDSPFRLRARPSPRCSLAIFYAHGKEPAVL